MGHKCMAWGPSRAKKTQPSLVRCPGTTYGPPAPDFNVGGLIGVVSRSEKNATFLFLKAGLHSGNIEIGGAGEVQMSKCTTVRGCVFFRTGREKVAIYVMTWLPNADIWVLYMS